ncbi:ribonuclease H-like domain-containing protein [Tanacetum coccineum]
MNCHATTTSPIPRSHLYALHDPNWHKAMVDEYNALISNRTQQQGIDCDETFSPVVKPATIRTVLSLAVTHVWPIHQLDVKNAFLHGQLSKTVYMHQPPGFVDSAHPDYVCHLQRSLYGLKQAPRAWFQHSKTDTPLFVYHMGSDVAYLLLYVDDIILTASSTALLQGIITLLHKEILERAHMQHSNPCKKPVDTESKLGSDGDPICLYMHDPRDPHFTTLKRILRYVRGTIDHGLQLHVSSTSQLTTYTNADWAGCPVTRRLHCLVLVLRQNIEVLQMLLLRLRGSPLSTATLVYCDNVSVVCLSTNLLQHQRTKNIEIDIRFVREYVAFGQVRVLHVPSRYADIFTKGLPTALFLEFRSSLNVRRSPAHTEGEYL